MVQNRRCRRGRLVAAALLLAAAGGFPGAAAARVDDAGRGAVELIGRELERTDHLLAKARDEVAGLRGALPQTLLDEAVKIQGEAWREFRAGAAGGGSGGQVRLRRARELTLRARERAIRAIEAAGLERRARESAAGLIDRAQERAALIGERVQASGSALAQQLFEQGLEQLRRARRALQGREPHAARLATLALDLIERAGGVAAGQPLGPALETSLERTEALLAQVEVALAEQGGAPRFAAALREARALLARAREEMRAGHPRAALRLSLEARKRGLEILSQMRRQPGAQELAAALEELEALHDQLAAGIAAGGSERAGGMLRQAGRLLADARRQIGEGRAEEALALVVAAEKLLREASAAAGLD